MQLELRPMRDSETPWVRDSWTRSFDVGRPMTILGGTTAWMRVGAESKIVGWAWYDAHRAWVRDHWPTFEITVATLPHHDEAIGWCAVSLPGTHPLVVHYTFVLDLPSARHKGIGSVLLADALEKGDSRPARFSHMTAVGRQMLDRVLDARAATIRGEALTG